MLFKQPEWDKKNPICWQYLIDSCAFTSAVLRHDHVCFQSLTSKEGKRYLKAIQYADEAILQLQEEAVKNGVGSLEPEDLSEQTREITVFSIVDPGTQARLFVGQTRSMGLLEWLLWEKQHALYGKNWRERFWEVLSEYTLQVEEKGLTWEEANALERKLSGCVSPNIEWLALLNNADMLQHKALYDHVYFSNGYRKTNVRRLRRVFRLDNFLAKVKYSEVEEAAWRTHQFTDLDSLYVKV
jgi:hypothetical protein